jgi:hypothetical protein
MAIIQHFDPQKNLFIVVWHGTVTADEWFQYATRLTSHPAWSMTPRLLADLQFAQDTSTIGFEEIANAVRIFSGDRSALVGKQIAVVARDQFGKARRFGDLIAPFGVALVVFNNVDTACLFLGVDKGYASSKIQELRKPLLEE